MVGTKLFGNLWAVILGGSSGFGLATAVKLASHGMNLVIVYRETAASQKEFKEKCRVIEIENNISIQLFNINALDAESRTRMIGEISKSIPPDSIKLLLHSIARGNLKPLTTGGDDAGELSGEDIQSTIYAMGSSLLDWTRAIAKAKLFHHDARVVGLSSEGAHKYWKGYAAVSMAKASLESLVTYMAVEFCGQGIKTNLIQAGVTQTPSMEKIPGSKELMEISLRRNPMGRITKTGDVANVVYLLCMDESSWINGALIHVDGGEHCC